MLLAARTLEQAKNLIDRGVAADGSLLQAWRALVLALLLSTDDLARRVRMALHPPPDLPPALGVELRVAPASMWPGEHDSLCRGWPGDNMFDAARKGDATLRSVLIAEVQSRGAHATLTPALQAINVVALIRNKVTPMVAGLFPRHQQAAVLALLERSVVFLLPENIKSVLRSMPRLHTAWSLMNLYLANAGSGSGSELLSPEASPIVGLSQAPSGVMSGHD